MPVKLVLFDFWGTLVENGTQSPAREAHRIMRVRRPFREWIGPFEDAFFTKRWESQEEGFTAAFDRFNIRAPRVAVEKLVGLWNKNKLLAKPYDETEEVLAAIRAKGIKIALISNTDNFSVDFVMDKYKMRENFDAVSLSCDLGKLKTDPTMINGVLEQLGIDKSEAMVVGDSMETDILGAKLAGVRGVLIDRRDRREFSPKVHDLKELLPYIDNFDNEPEAPQEVPEQEVQNEPEARNEPSVPYEDENGDYVEPQ